MAKIEHPDLLVEQIAISDKLQERLARIIGSPESAHYKEICEGADALIAKQPAPAPIQRTAPVIPDTEWFSAEYKGNQTLGEYRAMQLREKQLTRILNRKSRTGEDTSEVKAALHKITECKIGTRELNYRQLVEKEQQTRTAIKQALASGDAAGVASGRKTLVGLRRESAKFLG